MKAFVGLVRLGGIALAFCMAAHAGAQVPGKPIRLIVPYPPGGIADTLAREVATPLGPMLGTTVVVDNRAGAAGSMGASYVKTSEPDGTTFLFTNVGPSAIVPAMSKVAPYDPTKDFVAVSLVSKSPLMLVVPSTTDIRDTAGLIRAAKVKPGGIAYSSAGIGSFGHLSTELFAQASGVQLLHVPYQGQAPATLALLTGDVQMALTAPSAQMFEMVRDGKFRLLGVSSHGPSPLVPGAPPIGDVLPGFEAQYWFGVIAPARTSDAVVKRVDAAIQKILSDPALAKRFQALGNEVGSGTPAQFQKLVDAEAVRWRDVVKTANLQQAN